MPVRIGSIRLRSARGPRSTCPRARVLSSKQGVDMSLQESLRYLVSWDLDDLCNQPDKEAAHGLNERAKAWDFILERAPLAFSDYGRIAWEFQKRELWRHVLDEHEEPFHSFEHWVNAG